MQKEAFCAPTVIGILALKPSARVRIARIDAVLIWGGWGCIICCIAPNCAVGQSADISFFRRPPKRN